MRKKRTEIKAGLMKEAERVIDELLAWVKRRRSRIWVK